MQAAASYLPHPSIDTDPTHLEAGSVDGLAAGSVATGEISTLLKDQSGNYSSRQSGNHSSRQAAASWEPSREKSDSCMSRGVADLDHELRDDAMENAALVVQRLSRGTHALLA